MTSVFCHDVPAAIGNLTEDRCFFVATSSNDITNKSFSLPRSRDSRGFLHHMLVKLLRYALWDGGCNDIVLSDAGWLHLYYQAIRHKVQGVLYPAVSSLPPESGVPTSLIQKWGEMAGQIRARNRHVSHVADVQAAAWTRRGIRAVELKGRTAATFYPEPDLRVCGDIDWWFPDTQGWKLALVAARENGCYLETDSDGDVHYVLNGVVVEHHRKGLEVEGAVGQLLLFNTHILHHAMGAGIGLRHMCDLALALDALDGKYDRGEYMALLGARGLLKWNAVVEEVISYLKEGNESQCSRLAMRLLSSIMADGEFGLGRPHRFAGMARRACFFLRVAPRPFIRHWYHLVKGHFSR